MPSSARSLQIEIFTLGSSGGKRDFPQRYDTRCQQTSSDQLCRGHTANRCWSLSSSSSQPSTVVQTHLQWLLEGRWLTLYQCKPLSYQGREAQPPAQELVIPLRQQLLQVMQQDWPEVNQDDKLTSTSKSMQVCSQRGTCNPLKTRDYGLWS